MKFFNVLTKKEYEENGEMKEKWYRCGLLKVTENGGKYLRMFHLPDTTYYVLDQQEADGEPVPVID